MKQFCNGKGGQTVSIDSLEDRLEKALHDMEHDHDRIRSSPLGLG
jgi:hypothetical protein